MKTINDLFLCSMGKRFDYRGAIELYHFFDEEAIAARQLLDDAHIEWEEGSLIDEFNELYCFVDCCNYRKDMLKSYVSETFWEYEAIDFIPKMSRFGTLFADAEIEAMKKRAEKEDKARCASSFIAGSSDLGIIIQNKDGTAEIKEIQDVFEDIEEFLAF